jgi:hypothetical protein
MTRSAKVFVGGPASAGINLIAVTANGGKDFGNLGAKRADLSTATLTSANYHCVMFLSGLRVSAAIIRYAPAFPNMS